MDDPAQSRIGGRIPAAVAGVARRIVALFIVEHANDPIRLGFGKKADLVDEMSRVSEEHRSGTAEGGDDPAYRTDRTGSDQTTRLEVVGVPAPGVVDQERN